MAPLLRAPDCARYVQYLLKAAHADLRRWITKARPSSSAAVWMAWCKLSMSHSRRSWAMN